MYRLRQFTTVFFALSAAFAVSACLDFGGSGSTTPSGGSVNPNWYFLDDGSVNTAPIAAVPNATVFNSKVYAIWHEENPGWHINFGVFNSSATSSNFWTVLGGSNGLNKNPSVQALYGKLTVFNSKMYATWFEYDGEPQIRAAVYNGNDSAPAWTFIDGNGSLGMNYNTSNAALAPEFMVFNSKLYITWTEGSSDNNYQIRVAVYNGDDSSPSWSFVDGGSSSGLNYNILEGAANPQFAISNSKLYVTWSEDITANGNAGGVIRVKVYNGIDSSPSWSFVDGDTSSGLNLNSNERAGAPQLVTFNNKLYAGWPENTGSIVDGYLTSLVHVKVYNGNDTSPKWTLVDGSSTGLNINSSASAGWLNFVVNNSQLYASWEEVQSTHYPFWVKIYGGNDNIPAWNLLGNSYEPINCQNYGGGSGAQLLSFNTGLFAISSDQCPTNEVIRFEAYLGAQ